MATEKRLIDAEPYKEFLMQYAEDLMEIDAPMIAGAVGRCLSKLDGQPTVDAVEVIHAHWIPDGDYDICSHCNNPIVMDRRRPDRFCKHCGYKMDGERKDNE